MRETDILDSDIPGADPAAVVQQYEPLIFKIANRYMPILEKSGAVALEDLQQAGRIAILQAQKRYDPAGGASFMTFIYNPIRTAIRRAIGFDDHTGKAPEQLVYLDEPLPGLEDDELTRLDVLQDPDALPMDEPIIEDEARRETSEQVRAALDRMRSDKQRDIIQRVYLDGQTYQQAADETGMKYGAVSSLVNAGRSTLRRDWRLKQYALTLPYIHVGVSRFNSTWTSATEYAALWRITHLPESSPEPMQPESTSDRIRRIWNQEHAEPMR